MSNKTLRCWRVSSPAIDSNKIMINFVVEIPENYTIVPQNPVPSDGHIWKNVDGNAIPVYKVIDGSQVPSLKTKIEIIMCEVKLVKAWNLYNDHKSGIRIINTDNDPDDEETMSTSSADIGFLPDEDKQ